MHDTFSPFSYVVLAFLLSDHTRHSTGKAGLRVERKWHDANVSDWSKWHLGRHVRGRLHLFYLLKL